MRAKGTNGQAAWLGRPAERRCNKIKGERWQFTDSRSSYWQHECRCVTPENRDFRMY
jgi:hypothetical protein